MGSLMTRLTSLLTRRSRTWTSVEFVVECLNAVQGLKVRQVFWDTMHANQKSEVAKCSKSKAKRGNYTKLTFSPDLVWFWMEWLDKNTICLLSKYVYDIA